MQQLSRSDAELIRLESATTTAHVGTLLVLDPSIVPGGQLTLDRVRDVLEPRLHRAPLLRQRLVRAPLGLGRPYWVDDPDFDIEFHLRELALPGPGDDRQLGEQMARLHARPLDRSRPLWELYLVHGLEHGRQAVYAKVHSAAVDQASGDDVVSTLIDATVDPHAEPPGELWQPAPVPGQLDVLTRELAAMATQPREVAQSLPRALPHLADLPGVASLPGARVVAQVAGSLLHSAVSQTAGVRRSDLAAPATRLNRSITPHRRFAFASLPLDRIQRIETAYGVTVDDVVLALCTSTLRRWLLEHDALPETPLVVAVPVPVAIDDADDGWSDREAASSPLSLLLVELPTQVTDPEARLIAVPVAMTTAMAEGEQLGTVPPVQLPDVPATVAAGRVGLATRAALSLASPGGMSVNLVISDLRGPATPMYVAGAAVLGLYSAAPVTDVTGALAITLFTADESVDVGLNACRELVPDLWNFVDYFGDALDEIEGLLDAPRPLG